jgi:hypothetical protein
MPIPTFGADRLDWQDIGEGWQEVTVALADGESAWDPTSTKRALWGPGTVTYRRGPSRGVTAECGEGVTRS